MTLFELQEYCLANAVDAVISGDSLTITLYETNRLDPSYLSPILGRGYLDEPLHWLALP